MERNQNYWNKGLPYLDGIEFYNLLPFSPELGAAVLSGRVDYARALDPATARKAAAVQGMSTARFYQSVIHATWVNAKRPPFNDPRVRRALHLLCEKQVLVDVVKDVSPLMMGGFIYPFSEFATPKEQLAKRIGYQRTPPPRSRRPSLLAAAGQGSACGRWISWCGPQPSQAVRGRHPGEMCGRSSATCGRSSNRCGSATRQRATTPVAGAIVSSLLDPSDYFTRTHRWAADTRSGTTPSRRCLIISIPRSMPASAWR